MKNNRVLGIRALCVILCAAVTLIVVSNIGMFFSDSSGLIGLVSDNYSNPITAQQPTTLEIAPVEKRVQGLRLLLVPAEQSAKEPVQVRVFRVEKGTVSQMVAQQEILPQAQTGADYQYIAFEDTAGKGVIYRVELTSTETDPTRCVRLVTGSSCQRTDVTVWYGGDMQETAVPDVTLVYRALGTKTLVLLLCLLVMAWLGVLLPRHLPQVLMQKSWIKRMYLLASICVMLGWFALVLYFTEYFNRGSLLSLPIAAIAANLLLMLAAAMVLFALCGNSGWAGAVVSLFVLLLMVVNSFLLEFRGVILMPTDVLSLSTAARVMGNYTLRWTLAAQYALVLALDSVLWLPRFAIHAPVMLKAGKVQPKHRWLRAGLRLGCGVLGSAMLFVCAYRYDILGLSVDYWRMEESARKQTGHLENFAVNIANLFPQEPEGYDIQQLNAVVEEIAQTYESKTPQANQAITEKQAPNILFVMNEGFTDPTRIIDLALNQTLMPGLDALRSDPKAHVGDMSVSIFGGGTACTEFEVISGVTMRNAQGITAPYLLYGNRQVSSLAWQLTNIGYQTLGFHPQPGGNWYRSSAYPNFGFGRTIFTYNNLLVDSAGQMDGMNALENPVRMFPSDAFCYDVLMQGMSQSSEPLFALNVTMQNHGSYLDQMKNGQIKAMGLPEDIAAQANTYLSALHNSDEALTAFLERLEQFEEPTVVVLFGDHWSLFDTSVLGQMGLNTNDFLEKHRGEYYATPYVVWSNCGYDFSAMPEKTSGCYLAAQVMEQLGLPLTQQQKFLLYWAEKFPQYSAYVAQGTGTEEEMTLFASIYNWMQYNMLSDRSNYQEQLFAVLP